MNFYRPDFSVLPKLFVFDFTISKKREDIYRIYQSDAICDNFNNSVRKLFSLL